ncbi:UDP-N-acetylglucosamine 2-epimerase (non-hydrolyzing) [Spirosoma sp. BT702]|uniref:UDP-N-acetylglucosamine 2-epimerase (Non-hydrolyzing) n=1 Tax=Spirosoma profusum TaxID=2771354 RepID=A0A926XVL1_9BACT|nr:UDP-N-acetylglucosamine 2-epimerase (non-hydrolyzing) [Spirosoma profusum]MBD2700705.1 UDP-N-acetylglucosamine 2-epimerase (non-hydrolyzing) [Spirosoma profusum]
MLKLLTLIGARPQIIKASALSRAIRLNFSGQISEVIVHTGQHYDENMSAVFFDELAIPAPAYNLRVGSGKHGEQTAKMIVEVESILELEQPDYLILYGDTNSTLAGAIAASKQHVPIVHIEAGLRSYNKKMPEEVNRILTDHVSTYLFPPTQTGVENLQKEGFTLNNQPPYTMDNPGIFNVGDITYDNSLYFCDVAASRTDITERLQLQESPYALVTIHRNANTDDAMRLNAIFDTLLTIATTYSTKLIIPLHPRTAKQMIALLKENLYKALFSSSKISFLPPVSFLEMITLEQQASLIITDSGGVQKEAYYYQKPCIVLRSETEWVEIVENGAAFLCDANPGLILDAYNSITKSNAIQFRKIYGDGKTAESILNILSGK